MVLPVVIDPKFVERIIQQSFEDGLVPEIDGRLGRYGLMHICYNLRLLEPPSVVATDRGELILRAQVQGHISIPWGWGTKFMVDAEAELVPTVEGRNLHISVGEFEIDRMSIAGGCSYPQEILHLLGPFLKGALFPSNKGQDGGISIELPRIVVPLSNFAKGAGEIEVVLANAVISEQGIIVYIAQPGEIVVNLPPPPSTDGYDLAVAIPQRDAQHLIEKALGDRGVEVEGQKEFAIPDQTRLVDMLKASGETLTSLGRRGLGRRALKSTSHAKFNFKARVGAPLIVFQEGNSIALHDIPGHIVAASDLDMDMPTGGLRARLKGFFTEGSEEEKKAVSPTKPVQVTKWDIDEDFMIQDVTVSITTDKEGKIKWDVTKLEVDLELKWYLPERTVEEIIEFVGEKVAESAIPQAIPTELPLPGDMPLKVMLDKYSISTVPGAMFVRANVSVAPQGPAEKGREAIKETVEEQIATVLENRL